MDEQKLKPCPFCGSEPAVTWEPLAVKELYIRCDNNDCLGASFQDADPEAAIAAWNTRAALAEHQRRESAAQEPQMPTKQDYDIQGPFAIPFADKPAPAEDVSLLSQMIDAACLATRPTTGQYTILRDGLEAALAVAEPIITAKAREGFVPAPTRDNEEELMKYAENHLSVMGAFPNPPCNCRLHRVMKAEQQLAGTVTLEQVKKAVVAVQTQHSSGEMYAEDKVAGLELFEEIRARLTQQEPTERVRISAEGPTGVCAVYLDGAYVINLLRQDAERYAAGLRAEIAQKAGK